MNEIVKRAQRGESAALDELITAVQTMADVPQKPSRGHCCDGLFHCPNAHVWCSVLLFRHRPRPAQDPAFQWDEKSPCALGCTAIARSMGLPTAAQILAIRSRRKFGADVVSTVR